MAVNNVYYFDTNIILRFLLKDNESQYLVVERKLNEIKKSGAVVVVLGEVVAECVYVMEKIYKIPRLNIGGSLAEFLKTGAVFCAEKDVLVATLNDYSILSLSYVDVLLMQMIKKHGGKLVTFDKKLLAQK